MTQLKKDLHQEFAQAEREAMKQLRESYDWYLSKFRPENGQTYCHCSRNKKCYMTLAGEVSIDSLSQKLSNYCDEQQFHLEEKLQEQFEIPESTRLFSVPCRLKQWIARFHDVASKYLDHYLEWFRLMDTSINLNKKKQYVTNSATVNWNIARISGFNRKFHL